MGMGPCPIETYRSDHTNGTFGGGWWFALAKTMMFGFELKPQT